MDVLISYWYLFAAGFILLLAYPSIIQMIGDKLITSSEASLDSQLQAQEELDRFVRNCKRMHPVVVWCVLLCALVFSLINLRLDNTPPAQPVPVKPIQPSEFQPPAKTEPDKSPDDVAAAREKERAKKESAEAAANFIEKARSSSGK